MTTPTTAKHEEAIVEKPDVSQQENYLDEESDGKRNVNLDYSGAHAKTDPAEIKLVRKLDIWIMPMLWLMYWLNYLDRNAIALARLDNLEEELGISDSQYATCVSILFVGYLLAQVPSSKFPLVPPSSGEPRLVVLGPCPD